MTDDVLTFIEGKVGRIRLNRPKAIHALNTAMCAAVLDALAAWRHDPAVEAVMIDHAEGRGFCAGGDIRMLAESGAKDGAEARAFFHTEYRMNHRLFTYEKPVVAFMDGITMGGGVGISQPARYRVATENTRLAMPETGIGLFPDVGGGWYLSRLPGRVGQYLALTGHRLDGAECLNLGLASDYLTSDTLDEAKARIAAAPTEIEEILAELGSPVPEAKIVAQEEDINRLFESDRLEDILDALDAGAADGDDWAAAEAASIRAKSPMACKVTLKLLVESPYQLHFVDEVRMEYGIMVRLIHHPDFKEGVRALLIDKDNQPQWRPTNPHVIGDRDVEAFFEPLPLEEQWRPIDF